MFVVEDESRRRGNKEAKSFTFQKKQKHEALIGRLHGFSCLSNTDILGCDLDLTSTINDVPKKNKKGKRVA